MPVRKRGFQRISKQVGALSGVARDEMRNVIGQSTEAGAEAMRDRVRLSGTGKTWVGDWGGYPNGTPGRTGSFNGRIATGEMLDKIVSSVDTDSKFRVRGRFGWLRGSKPYFMFQDEGFRHALTGQLIEGMQAIRQGNEVAEEVFQEGAERVARQLARFEF